MFYVILYLIIVLFLLKNKKNAFKKKDQNINVIGYEDFNFKGNAMDLYKGNKYLLLDSNIGDLSFKSFVYWYFFEEFKSTFSFIIG